MTTRPTDAELSAIGLLREDFDRDRVEVWPDNIPAVDLFFEMNTQWRIGPQGPSGIDYGVLYTRLDGLAPDRVVWDGLYHDVRVMEQEALKHLRDRQ